jgi:anti-sigma factor RsiW
MKTFEEKYTAWIDGKLSGAELAAFERELEGYPEAQADRESTLKLGEFLRRNSAGVSLSHPDFFNHQILQRIEAEKNTVSSRGREWAWPRFAWAGFAALLVAGVLFRAWIPTAPQPLGFAEGGAEAPSFAEIVHVRAGDPSISVTPVYDSRDNVTVLWLEGLDYLPASYKLR